MTRRHHVTGTSDPVVQVIDEYLGEVVYTVRINGTSWRPKVFREAVYTIKIRQGDKVKVFRGLPSTGEEEKQTLEVEL